MKSVCLCPAVDMSEWARHQTPDTTVKNTHTHTPVHWIWFLTGLSNKSLFKQTERLYQRQSQTESKLKRGACESGVGIFTCKFMRNWTEGFIYNQNKYYYLKSNQTLLKPRRTQTFILQHWHRLSKWCCRAITNKHTSTRAMFTSTCFYVNFGIMH